MNTGEVVTGRRSGLVTGDAVNVAARLEQAAAPGEVLIGEATHELVGGAVEAEPVEPLVLKGKAEPVRAFRLLAGGAAPERRHDSLFVGRERELGLLRRPGSARSLSALRAGHGCGRAGIGKSRLVAEALAVDRRAGRARPLFALRRGDHLLAGRRGDEATRGVAGGSGGGGGDPLAARREDARTSAEEIGWAFRTLLAEQAPLVVVLDDIQWGEETFLDLVEHVALLSTGRRCCCSAWPGRSCSTAGRPGRSRSDSSRSTA